jgi:hypothetical protein
VYHEILGQNGTLEKLFALLSQMIAATGLMSKEGRFDAQS